MKTKWLYLIGFLFFFGEANGQIIINPIQPNVPVLNIDYLKNIQVINPTSAVQSGRLIMEIRSQTALLLKMESQPLTISANGTLNKNDIFWNEGFEVSDQNFIYSLMLSGQFKSGSYEYCYKFIGDGAVLLGMRCQENFSLSASPPELKFPFNRSTIKSTLPHLRWLTPLPIIGKELSYAIKLVEINEHQSNAEALVKNLPLLERRGLKTNFYQYSNFDIPLEIGKDYAWKVFAYWNDLDIGETSTWRFSIGDDEISNTNTVPESYRSLKTSPDGTSYTFSNMLFIRYVNKSNYKYFEYQIHEVGNQEAVVTRIPRVELTPGLNQIEIDLRPLNLDRDKAYMLRAKGAQDTFSYLQFSIK